METIRTGLIINGERYLSAYRDVANFYLTNDQYPYYHPDWTPDQVAEHHWLNFGRYEGGGRISPYENEFGEPVDPLTYSLNSRPAAAPPAPARRSNALVWLGLAGLVLWATR